MTVLIVVHAFVCLFLVIVILLQPGKGDAGVDFGSASQSILGSKGAGSFLTKLTSVCAVMYLLLSFILTRSRIQDTERSVIGNEEVPAAAAPTVPPPAEAPAPPAPSAKAEGGKPADGAKPAPKK